MSRSTFKTIAKTQPKIGNGLIALCCNAPLIAEVVKLETESQDTIRITNYETKGILGIISLNGLTPSKISFSPNGEYLGIITEYFEFQKIKFLFYTFCSENISLVNSVTYPKNSCQIFDVKWIDENNMLIAGASTKHQQIYINVINVQDGITLDKDIEYSPEDGEIADAACSASGSVGFLYTRIVTKHFQRDLFGGIPLRRRDGTRINRTVHLTEYYHQNSINTYQITMFQGIDVIYSRKITSEWPSSSNFRDKIYITDNGQYFVINNNDNDNSYRDCYLFNDKGEQLDLRRIQLPYLTEPYAILYDDIYCIKSSGGNNSNKWELNLFLIRESKFFDWQIKSHLEIESNSLIGMTKMNNRNIIAISQEDGTKIFELQDIDIIYLDSEKPEEQLEAIHSLAERKFSPAIPALVDLLNKSYEKKEQNIATEALEALVQIGDNSALPYLIRALGDRSKTDFRETLFSAIKQFSLSKITQATLDCLNSNRKISWRGAAWLLERMPMPCIKVLDVLCKALSHVDTEIRQSLVRSLGKKANLRACPSLLAYLNDEDLDTQKYVQEALVKCLASNDMLSETVRQQISLPMNIVRYAKEVIDAGRMEAFEGIGAPISGQFLKSLAEACTRENQPVTQILDAVERLTVQRGTSDIIPSKIALTIALICANVMRQQQRWKGAIGIYHRAVELAKQIDTPHLEWRIWYAIGECAEQDGSDRQALGSFQKAMDIIDRLWFALLEEDKLRHFFQDKAQLYDHAELCCLRLGHKALALECREKAKTRYLGDLIARRQREPQVQLERELRDFWRQLDKARPVQVSVGSGDTASQTQFVIGGVEWGEDEGQGIKPECLAKFEEAAQENSNLASKLTMLHTIWELIAKVSSIKAEDESIYECLKDICQILEKIQHIVKAGELLLLASERSSYVSTFQELAKKLSGFPRENDYIPFSIFTDLWLQWLEEIGDEHTATEGELFLDAVIEALNVVVNHSPVIGLPVDSDEDRKERPIFTLGSGNASTKTDTQRTTIIETALEKVSQSRWQYVTRIARGEVSSFKEIETALADHPHTAQLEFSITEQGTIVYIIQGQQPSERGSAIPNLIGQENLVVFTFPDVKSSVLNQRLTEGEKSWLYCYQNRHRCHGLELWQNAMDEAFEWLSVHLINPIDEYLKRWKIERLLIVPNRALNLIPFSALYYKDKENKKHYLVEEYEIGYAPSSTLQQICRERATDRKLDNSLTAIENPTGDLRYAEQEVEILSKYFIAYSQQILRGQEASLERVKNIEPKSFYHFACHGIYQWQQPLESGLLLAQHQKLQLSSLFEESISLPSTMLVMLSACETGISDPNDLVDEYIGLAAGFLFAGVPCVVSSLWAVDDLATMLLMTKFYESLFTTKMSNDAKLKFTTAMQEAQKWLRQLTLSEVETATSERIGKLPENLQGKVKTRLEEIKRHFEEIERHFGVLPNYRDYKKQGLDNNYPFKHPYYWASFVVVGI
jgi:CHAT domain-containing protein/HEAT repeat protein